MLNSNYQDLGAVALPPYRGRQKYMHALDLDTPQMCAGFEDYTPTVVRLCKSAGVVLGRVHVTIDEKIIQPGMSQRRPGAHVDGCFFPELNWWGHQGPAWNHYCNGLPYQRMAVIVASDVPGCIGYAGQFEGAPKSDGDLEHIRGQIGTGELLPASRGFLLSPDCVHESIRFTEATKRTFLRIALPLGEAQARQRQTPNSNSSRTGE